ncbi:MAG: hypothetical protein U9O96_07620 [Candidatus Thermoplasmatota archaeon]|nr:hypothetical protein [Candidatus Thermoplasmatota archaeon]
MPFAESQVQCILAGCAAVLYVLSILMPDTASVPDACAKINKQKVDTHS